MSIVTKENNPELYNSLFENSTIEDAKKVMQNMFNDITPEQFEKLKKQAIENVKKNNISAKEMFEKLGYKLYKHQTYMFYEKALKKNPKYENDYEHIEFNFISETINKTYGDDNSVSDITLEELQAINKQVEELHWND